MLDRWNNVVEKYVGENEITLLRKALLSVPQALNSHYYLK